MIKSSNKIQNRKCNILKTKYDTECIKNITLI